MEKDNIENNKEEILENEQNESIKDKMEEKSIEDKIINRENQDDLEQKVATEEEIEPTGLDEESIGLKENTNDDFDQENVDKEPESESIENTEETDINPSESAKEDNNVQYGMYDTSSKTENKEPTSDKKEENYKRCLMKGVLFALVFGGVAGITFAGTSHFLDSITNPNKTVEVQLTKTTSVGTDNYNISDIVEECMPSVVSITNVSTTEFQTIFGTYAQQSQSSGSGIIVGKNDTELLIVTNNHVVSNANEISVYFNSDGEDANSDNVITAKVKGKDANKDIAVLSVSLNDIPEETLNNIKIATIGDSSTLKVGEPVIAIGNAYGYGLSVTSGIVSAKDREVSVESDNQIITNKLIQTDAAINPGNSGGALLNSKGELIGINSVKFISEDVEGMGYAIPISDVETIIDTFMNRETRDVVDEDKRGYLGIQAIEVDSEVSETYNIPKGVFVHDITNEKSNLKQGDIITEVNGISINTVEQLKEELSYYKAGENVKLKIERLKDSGYQEMELETSLIPISK